MKNCVEFQTQLASIMEVLAKAAVVEISKLVDDGSVALHLEIDSLRRKLLLVESDPRTAQESAARERRSIGVQVENLFGGADGEVGVDAGQRLPIDQQLKEKKCNALIHNTRPGFGFTVKTEQEEEHVAERINQTGCEHSAGRLNNLGSEYVMYERDGQLWTSFPQGDSDVETDPVCASATEQCSRSLSIHSPLQHASATMEVSGSAPSSLGKDDYAADGVLVKEEAGGQCSYSEENSRSEMGGTQQTEYRQPPPLMNDHMTSQLWQPLQQPLDWQVGTDNIADPNSNSSKKTRIQRRTGITERPYSCTLCEKNFDRFIDFERHQRIHTGEKPFSCAQCGKCFSLRCNLITHERVHSGNKPFGCAQCGKRFAQRSHLRAHHRIHTGEKPYHCTLCGKNFTQLSGLKTHQKVHNRTELLEFGINCM